MRQCELQKERGSQAPSDTGSLSSHDSMASLNDLDEDVDTPNTRSRTKSRSDKPPLEEAGKPVNAVMECCTDEVAMALRLDQPELAIGLLQNKLTEEIIAFVRALQSGTSPGDIRSLCQSVTERYLSMGLDDDGNTLLHYATYYESSEMIGYLSYKARSCDVFPGVFLNENVYGHIPLEFSKWGYRKDPAIHGRMEALTDAAREEYKVKNPTMEMVAEKFWNVVRNINWSRLFNVTFSFLIGTRLFGCGIIVSFAVCALVQYKSAIGEVYRYVLESEHVAVLFATHTVWYLVYSVTKHITGALYLFELPYLIFLGGCFVAGTCLMGSYDLFLLESLSSSFWLVGILANLFRAVCNWLPDPPQIVFKMGLERSFYLTIFSGGMYALIHVYRYAKW